MLRYNTSRPRLILPEYGRNIQQMVDYCLTIGDREERNHCARSIIDAMGVLFPALRDSEDARHKLWDHLAIMSGFKLDIDYPYEVILPDDLNSHPDPLPRPQRPIRLRHYGAYIEEMLAVAAAMEPGEERDYLIRMLANHMKKLMLAVNPDGVDDQKIFKDIALYSHGAIHIDPDTVRLHEFKAAPVPVAPKKKRRKR